MFELLGFFHVSGASGFFYDSLNDTLYCCSLTKNVIYKISYFSIDSKRVITTVKNKLLNRPHSLILKDGFFYITSSGIDSILIFDLNFKLINAIVLSNLGYSVNPLGKEVKVDLAVDYSNLKIPTLCQSTHVNYAYPLNKDWLILSLFHQGAIVLLNTKNMQKKDILTGLKNPHGCLPYKYGFYVCDSANGRIVLLDKKLSNPKVLISDLSWIQSAEFYDDKFYLVESNESKITVVNLFGKIVATYKTNPKYRSFNLKII